MASFGKSSLEKLDTLHPKLRRVMEEAIHHFDFTIVCGYRSKEEQMELFKIGRTKENGQWKVTGRTVTNIDGLSKMSMHNHNPSRAVDIAPYPIDWSDHKAFKELAKIVKQSADNVGVKIKWGGDWSKFKDEPHFELDKTEV